MQSLPINLLALLGLTTLLYYTYKVTASIHLFFLHKSTLPTYQTPENSNYALVTGASDGIGRGTAEALLSRNFNVILHGRNATKLEAVKSDLAKQYPARQIRFAILDAAASARDHAAVDALVSELKADNVKVSVLINNVGGASFLDKAWVPLHLREGKEIDALIDVNATFASQITRAMLPVLFEREKALIINIGSVTGELPSPYLTPYAGSKAYNAAWSRGLRAELRCEKKDVEVIHINVGQVRASHDRGDPTLFAPSSGRMGQAVLDVVGCGKPSVIAYWPHALQMALITSIPTSLLQSIMIQIALQKKDEEEKGIKSE